MHRFRFNVAIAALIFAIFGSVLFLFQVRQTEIAVVTTFGRPSQTHSTPGLRFRWPWPIQKVHKLDNRLQILERKFEQTTSSDGRSLIISVFAGWRISNPRLFMERFPQGDYARAELALESVVRDAKNSVIGRFPFSDLISTNPSRLKLRLAESEMLAAVRTNAAATYGIEVPLLGIKQLGLPESITAKVFDRMRAERQRLVKQFLSEGDAEAIRIRANADRHRQETLAKADAEATAIRGEAEAEVARHFSTFEQEPRLAEFLIQINALTLSLKDRSTLILDPQTSPFHLLVTDPPAARPATNALPSPSHLP